MAQATGAGGRGSGAPWSHGGNERDVRFLEHLCDPRLGSGKIVANIFERLAAVSAGRVGPVFCALRKLRHHIFGQHRVRTTPRYSGAQKQKSDADSEKVHVRIDAQAQAENGSGKESGKGVFNAGRTQVSGRAMADAVLEAK